MIADVGSALENDPGTMTSYNSMLLDRKEYLYNCYHFSAKSLGPVLLKTVLDSAHPRSAFARPAAVRVQPTITNLLADEDSSTDYSTLLPPVTELNWDFSL